MRSKRSPQSRIRKSKLSQFLIWGLEGLHPTVAIGINSANNVVGNFIDKNLIYTHGFYRNASGKITQIDFPGSHITSCLGINDLGEITGFYVDTGNVAHGFTRIRGKFRTSALPDIAGINDAGTFVGFYTGQDQKGYGYMAAPQSSNLRR